MNRKALRIISIIVIMAILVSTVAYAAMEASEYIAVTSAGIVLNGDTVSVNFYIVGTDTMDLIGLKYIYLYELNGSTWSLVKTYSYTNPIYAATLMVSNSSSNAGSVQYSGSAGKQYYALCWFYAEKDGGHDIIPQNAF